MHPSTQKALGATTKQRKLVLVYGPSSIVRLSSFEQLFVEFGEGGSYEKRHPSALRSDMVAS